MEQSIEILKPFERKGNDIVVNLKKTIIEAGMPPVTKYLFVRLENCSDKSDDDIMKLAKLKVYEHFERQED